jgi:hypothetical protein
MSAGRTCCTNSSKELTAGRIAFSISFVSFALGPICRRAKVSSGENASLWCEAPARVFESNETLREYRLLLVGVDNSALDRTRGRVDRSRK